MGSDTSLVFNLVAKEKVTETLGKVSEKVGTAAAGISAAIAGALGKGVADAMDTEAITDKLAAQMGVSGQDAADFGKLAGRLYSKGMGESMQDSADTIKSLWQQGLVDGGMDDLEALATKVMTVGQVFDQESSDVTKAVSQMLKTGLAQTTTEALDIITAGYQNGADKAEDYIDTINEYGVQFHKFGLDGAAATGLIAQGLRAGARDGDLVADSIKEFSLRSISGSDAVNDAFKSLGLSAQTMVADIGAGGPKAAGALDQTLDKLRAVKDPVEQATIAATLFGTQAEDMGQALFALDPSSAVAGLGNIAGAADRAAQTIGDNPAAALEKFKREAQQKLTEIGGQFVTWAMNNQQYMQPLAITLGAVAGAILVVRGAQMAWAAAQAVWSGVQTVATGVQWAWNAALAANPITLIIIAVIALVAAIVLLWQKSETFRDIVTGAFHSVLDACQVAWSWIVDNWNKLIDVIAGPIGTAVGWVRDHFDSVKSTAMAVFNWFLGIPDMITSTFVKVGDIIASPFKAGFNMIASFWNRTVGGMGFSVPQWVPMLGGNSFSIPKIPLLAKGGHLTAGGSVVVGDAGPEILDLPSGATVTPLSRAAAGGGQQTVRIELSGPQEVRRLIRYIVRTDGRGDVQTAFGTS